MLFLGPRPQALSTMNSPKQLLFPFQVDRRASFDNFFTTPKNSVLLDRLREIIQSKTPHEVLIDGLKGSGKSFLIQSICNEYSQLQNQLAFVPRSKALDMGVEVLHNLASLDVVCIDDLQLISANREWEIAVFNLINECQQSGCSLIFSIGSDLTLNNLIELPDLLSRIKRMENMTLSPIIDNDLLDALVFISKQLDINLEDAELEFLLKNHVRDLSILVQSLVLLDQRGGELKRKITIPFIKEILNL